MVSDSLDDPIVASLPRLSGTVSKLVLFIHASWVVRGQYKGRAREREREWVRGLCL